MENINKNVIRAITKKLQDLDSDISGALNIRKEKNTYIVAGEITTKKRKLEERITEYSREALEDVGIKNAHVYVKISYNRPSLTITSNLEEKDTIMSTEDPLEKEVFEILYQGNLTIGAITPTDSYKRLHPDNMDRVRNAIRVTEFISPIILNEKFEIVDGNLRYNIAKSEGHKTLPVMVIKATDDVLNFIRLTVNRSSEFQRWKYDEVDNFVDSHARLQPALEPLGFFGINILPVSFFTNTVLEYEVADFDSQQKAYRQEKGLAAWAEEQREKRAAELKRKERARRKKEKVKTQISLFQQNEPEDQFLEVANVEKAREESVADMKAQAELITETYDAHRKEIIGDGKWQNDRRSAKTVFKEKKEAHSKSKESNKNEVNTDA